MLLDNTFRYSAQVLYRRSHESERLEYIRTYSGNSVLKNLKASFNDTAGRLGGSISTAPRGNVTG
jgi:hypothetical protein